jgi:DNA-3-methyladenine glycosylase
MSQKLSRKFYLNPDTVAAARGLLGKLIVVPDELGRRVSGMIVETEAYLGTTDRAAHSYGGRRTPRNEVTYGTGGHAYVFFIYGMYYQLNVVIGPADLPHVVLIRAVEPVEGIEIMRERRGFLSKPGAIATGSSALSEPGAVATGSMPDKNLTSGPGKLCIALNITRELNAADLLGDRIWLEDHHAFTDAEIASGKRIGIDYAGEDAEKPWRFWVNENEFVSKR